MIHKHEIPILEFDDNPQAVLMPTHEGLDLHLPEKCIYAFLEDEIDRFAEAVGAYQDLSGLCHGAPRRGNLLGASTSWLCSCCPIHGLVDWLWSEEDHFRG